MEKLKCHCCGFEGEYTIDGNVEIDKFFRAVIDIHGNDGKSVFWDGTLPIYICPRCGTIRTNPKKANIASEEG